ncbi:MAG: superinfection immunity protein [Chlorobiaceae bacterium]|nr:superinfection immunity protein [Chlorobiaceae bacterium]NTW11189.1 superinfection immunity protein [Chlorobiaceae bacterium]
MLDSFFSSSTLYALFIGSLIMYFLPAIIAVLRGHPQKLPIFILDFLAGWTVVGWIVAVVWACTKFDTGSRVSLPPASEG